MHSMSIVAIGLFNVLSTLLKFGQVAQWLKFWAVNHETMGSNQDKTIFI